MVRVRFAVLIPLLLSLSACSARQSNAPAGADDAADAQPDYDVNRISVPFLVDDHFIPSGCMGDCANSVSIDSDCPTRGSPDAQGECHHFVFTAASGASALGWAGVLWQTTEKNWGSLPGRQVAPGATGLHFYAAGEAGGEKLDFLVGGMVPADAGKSCDSADACASCSAVAPKDIATTISWMSSETSGPTAAAPTMRFELCSTMSFTKPSVSPNSIDLP